MRMPSTMTATQTLTVSLSHPHAGQRQVLREFERVRFGVVNCGRRWGKSETGKHVLIQCGLAGGVAWWISPTYKMASDTWRRLKQTLMPITIEKNEVEHRLDLVTNGTVQVWSGHEPNALRGAGLDLAVMDEAAYLHPDVWRAAIRPALSDKRGRALFLSTPNGRNWFWDLWMHGNSPDHADWKAWHFPTVTSPIVGDDEVEQARQLLPERIFRQEYLAEFLDDGGVIFRNLTACQTSVHLDAPEPGHTYVCGLDWAKDQDFTVITVLDKDTHQLVHMDRFNEVGWRVQRGRLRALAEAWQPVAIWAEENSIGGPNIEELQAEGLPVFPFMTTATSKGPLIESLALAFEQGDIGLYADPILMGELQAYTMERLPSGRYRYSAPVGMHDDTVIALALAWHGATLPRIGFVG